VRQDHAMLTHESPRRAKRWVSGGWVGDKSGVEGVSVEVSAEQILLLFACQEILNLRKLMPQ
jgi:hypothetical protein